MDYEEFINFVDRYQTERIKPLSLPRCCSPDTIPSFIGYLLDDVINIIETHFNEFSDNKSSIGIFSLQPVSLAFHSTLPKKLNRIWDSHYDDSHVCCVLSFIPITNSTYNNQSINRLDAKQLIIDFTRGIVMNEKQYLHELFHQGELGKIYGQFNQIRLCEIWEKSLH